MKLEAMHIIEVAPVLVHWPPSSIFQFLLNLGLGIGALLGLCDRFSLAPSNRRNIPVKALGFALVFELVDVTVLDGVHIEIAFKPHFNVFLLFVRLNKIYQVLLFFIWSLSRSYA